MDKFWLIKSEFSIYINNENKLRWYLMIRNEEIIFQFKIECLMNDGEILDR